MNPGFGPQGNHQLDGLFRGHSISRSHLAASQKLGDDHWKTTGKDGSTTNWKHKSHGHVGATKMRNPDIGMYSPNVRVCSTNGVCCLKIGDLIKCVFWCLLLASL